MKPSRSQVEPLPAVCGIGVVGLSVDPVCVTGKDVVVFPASVGVGGGVVPVGLPDTVGLVVTDLSVVVGLAGEEDVGAFGVVVAWVT